MVVRPGGGRMTACPKCDGSGISSVYVNGHFKTCEYCNGTGEVFQCPKCGEITHMNNIGSLFDHDYAWYRIECPKCGYFSDGGTDPNKAIDMFVKGMGDMPKPLTEQEYIQSCNTEQLAEWLQEHMDCTGCGCNKDLCYQGYDCCKLAFVEWLKQPHNSPK